MTQTISQPEDRLDRIERFLETSIRSHQQEMAEIRQLTQSNTRAFEVIAERQAQFQQDLQATRLVTESNARAIEETRLLTESNARAIEETRLLTESNARAIQSDADASQVQRNEIRSAIGSLMQRSFENMSEHASFREAIKQIWDFLQMPRNGERDQ